MSDAVRIRGACRAFFAFHLGLRVDLEEAARRLPSFQGRVVLRHRGRDYPMDTRSRPLRLAQRREPVAVGPRSTFPDVEIILFDYGAACVSYQLPLEGTLEDLPALSALLYNHAELHADARAMLEELVRVLGDAVDGPGLLPLVEDYVVFRLAPDSLGPPSVLWEKHGAVVAGALRAATEPLSGDEVRDALSQRIAYGDRDAVLVDWFAALVVGDEVDDEVSVLEFATVELLELRVLDSQLDQGLEDAYRILRAPPPSRWNLLPGGGEDGIGRVARLQADAALILEGATNPAKLIGDQYLARMYRVVAERFRLAEWEAAVDRKLHTVDSVYQKLSDRESSRRLEALEWIIIVLIAISIAIYFLPQKG